MTKTIKSFCANCQVETDQTLDIDGNGEIILTCTVPECGRFVKYPKGTDATTLKVEIEKHKFSNEGQLTVEGIEKEKDALIDALIAE